MKKQSYWIKERHSCITRIRRKNKMARKSKSIRMAFWNYDLYPYILCGEVDEKLSTGNHLYIPSYQCHVDHPLFVLSIKEGRILEAKLKSLRQQRRQDEKEINNRYMKLLNDCLGELGLRSIK